MDWDEVDQDEDQVGVGGDGECNGVDPVGTGGARPCETSRSYLEVNKFATD